MEGDNQLKILGSERIKQILKETFIIFIVAEFEENMWSR